MSAHSVDRLVVYVAHYLFARAVWREVEDGVEGGSGFVFVLFGAVALLLAVGWRHRRGRDRYYAALKSRHWKRLRVLAYRRSGGRCESCRKRMFLSALQLHHKTYRKLGKERLSEVELLCDGCHLLQHGRAAA